jgi:hypothetical protein
LSQSAAEQHRLVHTIDLVERQIDHISRCVPISVPNCVTECTSSHEWLFLIEPGWAGNGSRFDPTAHNFRLAKQFEQTCEVLYSLILIIWHASLSSVGLSPTFFDLPMQVYIVGCSH